MSADEVAARIETACAKLNGYTIWLPEHLAKTGMSIEEGKAVVDRAAADFAASLESLDPPADLKDPIEQLAAPEGSPKTQADLKAQLEEKQSLYEQVGADRCGKAVQASILTVGGASVEGAYRKVGVPLPPHPDGW